MLKNAMPPRETIPLLAQVTCCHCWHPFSPEQGLWVAEHQDLMGDPVLGPDQRQRFLPSRFTPDCHAIDARGFSCHLLACPRCHLVLPRQVLETEQVFVSILGAPASGKSYFLCALTWELRRVLPNEFGLSFADADPELNQSLSDAEAALFLNQEPGRLHPLADLVNKTALEGDLYNQVRFGEQTVKYVRPLLFTLRPDERHPRHDESDRLARILSLYDNAGEHFQPGMDTTASPVTRHLARSRFLLYLFDPTQDPRFRGLILQTETGGTVGTPKRDYKPQVPILQEAATRIRRLANLPQNAKHERPLLVILTKFDQWSTLLQEGTREEPRLRLNSEKISAIDFDRVEQRSVKLRDLLRQTCPELISAAEGFARHVVYFPTTALGWSVMPDPKTGVAVVRPSEIRPYGVSTPLLYALARWMPGLVRGARRRSGHTIGKVTRE